MVSKGLEFTETTLLVFGFEFCKNTFVISSPSGYQVIKDAREFVSRVLSGDWGAEPGPLRSVEIAKIGFTVVKALSREAERIGGPVFRFDSGAVYAPSGTGSVLRRKVEPRTKIVGGRKLR